ncbi:MAG: BrnA antitoxin family protein [Candidatus Latescibacterota bacterium]
MNGENTKISSGKITENGTDLERLEGLTDTEIEQAVKDDPDTVFLENFQFNRVEVVRPHADNLVQLDNDVINWFKGQAEDYQSKMNAVLRSYIEAQVKI